MATALLMTSDRKPLASPDFRASNCLLCNRLRGHQGCALRAICCLPNPAQASHAAIAEQLT